MNFYLSETVPSLHGVWGGDQGDVLGCGVVTRGDVLGCGVVTRVDVLGCGLVTRGDVLTSQLAGVEGVERDGMERLCVRFLP